MYGDEQSKDFGMLVSWDLTTIQWLYLDHPWKSYTHADTMGCMNTCAVIQNITAVSEFSQVFYYAVCSLLCGLQCGRLIACYTDLKQCTGRNVGKLECAKRPLLCLSTPQPLAIWEQGPGNLSLMGNLLLIDLHFAMPASRTPITQAVTHITGISASLSLWCHRILHSQRQHTPHLLNDAVQYSRLHRLRVHLSYALEEICVACVCVRSLTLGHRQSCGPLAMAIMCYNLPLQSWPLSSSFRPLHK